MVTRKNEINVKKSAAVSKKKAHPDKIAAAPSVPHGIEDRAIGTLMRLTLAKLRDKLRKRLASEGLPWSVWPFMRSLWDEDELSQRELTAHVGLRQPTTVAAVQTMERLGLVRLRRDDEDRRKVVICLTDKGKRLKARLLPDVIILNERVALQGFTSKDAAELKRLLSKMHRNLSD